MTKFKQMSRFGMGALVVLALAAGCKGKKTADDDEPQEAATKAEAQEGDGESSDDVRLSAEEMLAYFDRAWQALEEGDADAFAGAFQDLHTIEIADGLPAERITGAELVSLVHAFSGLELSRQLVVLAGTDVAVIFRMEGTHDGELWTIEPTQEEVSVFGGLVAKMNRHGEIHRAVLYLDQATLLAQLGERPREDAPRAEDAWSEPVQVAVGRSSRRSDNYKAFNATYMKSAQAGDIAGVLEAYADDAVLRDVRGGREARGTQEVGRYLATAAEKGARRKALLDRPWIAGDWIAAETIAQGIVESPPAGARGASGTRVRLRQLELFRFDEGRIAEHWILGNELFRQRELGLFDASSLEAPEPDSAGPGIDAGPR